MKQNIEKHKQTIFDIFFTKWYTPNYSDRELIKVCDIMIFKNDISTIKTELCDRKGQKIIIKGTLGRNKAFEEEAIIKDTYANIFVVENKEKDTNASYKYTDILTKDLEVSVYNGENYSPLALPIRN